MDDVETHRRRELFWELFTYDSWQCLTFGRPPSFALPHIDCKMPYPNDPTDEQCRGGDIEDAWQHTQSASKWNIVPDSHMLLYPDEVENDDALHNPNDYDRDDIGCGRWTIRGLINISGLILVTLGVVMTFLGWPVM